ncbi:helix-turn-helix transcriptional regulator [Rhodococcus kronopolitis]|uniref:LuxR C-terminal-related transcriptional regulator n=1 Tax=Rhodococcus kronopolitis TaxID=1460226 RepID=A0ABV9FUM4_9NOCA
MADNASDVALTTRDYERVFGVLEACAPTRTVDQFREQVVDAMVATFPVKHATCFIGQTFASQFTDSAAAAPHVDSWERVRAVYHRQWVGQDIFSTPQARRTLEHTGAASLREMHHLPDAAARYVRDYLYSQNMHSASALHLEMPGGGHALVGLFDTDEHAIGPRDLAALRLLSRQLSVLTRGLATTATPDPVLAVLPRRQREVARLVADGLSNAAIGSLLSLTEDSVKKYVSRILAATGHGSRTGLALAVLRELGHPAQPSSPR